MSGKSPRTERLDALVVARRWLSAVRRVVGRIVGSKAEQRSLTDRRDDLFERALRVPPSRRTEFVADACANDVAMMEDLQSLLGAHDAAGNYFDALEAKIVAPVVSAAVLDATSKSDVSTALEAELSGTFRFEQELAGGGMSRVFVAEDVRLKRRVVIKVVPPDMARIAHPEQFRSEIELTARLQHPLIVPVLSTDSVAGLLYYTMPFVSGESLDKRLEREGALPTEDAVRIWRDVLDALAYAHLNGIVHRDVKPGNILLSGRHAMVTDFGISRAIESASASTLPSEPRGRLVGTPAYLAPEETYGSRKVDRRADIYGAGLVMYEMLAGVPPFVESSSDAYIEAHRLREPPPLLKREVPTGLLGLVMQCLSKDPGARPATADEILASLDRFAHEISAPSPSTTEARRRPIRHRSIAALALPVVTAGVALAVYSLTLTNGSDERTAPTATVTTPDIVAYEWYRRGTDRALLRTGAGRLESRAYLEKAIAADSTFAKAYAGLAHLYLLLSHAVDGQEKAEWIELGRQAAFKAVELDDSDAAGRAALGWFHLLSRRYAASRDEFLRAVELDRAAPRAYEGLARVYMMVGEPAQQLSAATMALDVDPVSYAAVREWALALATNGRCEESLDRLGSLKALSPPAAVAGVISGQCYASKEMWTEAIAEFEWASAHGATTGPALLGFALARAGRTEDAMVILSELVEGRQYSHGSWGVAIVLAGMGTYDEAFAWLDKAIDDRTMHFYMVHPAFADLHRDGRFERIRTRMAAEYVDG